MRRQLDMYHILDVLRVKEDQRCQELMAWISSKDLMGNDVNVEASYKDLLHCRKMRQTYAIEAALELRKCFNSAQNYIKMLDLSIDEIEKDPEFKLTN